MSDLVSCQGCGHQIHELAAKCPQCGAPQAFPPKITVTTDDGSKVTADETGAIVIGFGAISPRVKGKTLILQPVDEDGRIIWRCTEGTLAQKYWPRDCRAAQ